MTAIARLLFVASCVPPITCGGLSVPDPGIPSIRIFDQRLFRGTVVVQEAVSTGPG